MMSLASVCVLFACLLMTSAAFLFILEVNNVIEDLGDENVVTVYFSTDVSEEQLKASGDKIKAMTNIKSCEFVSKDQAIQQYARMMGQSFNVLSEDGNFLPDAYRITLIDPEHYNDTIEQIKNMPKVDTISDRSVIANKLAKINTIVSNVGIWVIIFMAVVSLFIISNTIKITMYNRRLEISIMKSVGATNTFIRMPFIVEGMFIGIIAAVLALCSIAFLYNSVMDTVLKIASITFIEFNSILYIMGPVFLVAGAMFGILGGIISINRYLHKEGSVAIV